MIGVVRTGMHGLGAFSDLLNSKPAATTTTSTAPANPYAAARAVVDTSTAAFKTTAGIVRAELFPAGYQQFEEAPDYWKMIQYPESVYACNQPNMVKVTFRPDVWLAAQQNLARLRAVGDTTFKGTVPAIGTAERKYFAALFADWYVCIMSWVSIAAFATNIQPAFLLPDSPGTLIPNGQYVPMRTPGDGLPQALATLRNEIKGLNSVQPPQPGQEFAASWLDKGVWGPTWMGFTDTAEATGWLRGEFKPVADAAVGWLVGAPGAVDWVAPAMSNPPAYDWKSVYANIMDPWYQVFYTMLWFDFGQLLSPWTQHNVAGRNRTYTHWLLGPQALRRIADAWAGWVTGSTIMDVILASSTWYSVNYMAYWDAKGLLTFPKEQAAAASAELAKQKMLTRQAAATQTIDAIGSAGVTVAVSLAGAVPWGTVAAAGALLVSGLAKLICRRRRKKKIPVPVMQPLMLRTLSSPDCNYFPPGTTLDSSLVKFLDQVKLQTAELNAAPAGVVPAIGMNDPLATATLPPVTGTAPTVTPNASSSTSPGDIATGATINTSTSAQVAPQPPVPSVQEVAAQAVQASQIPPIQSGVAPIPSQIPWGVVGVSGAVFAAVLLTRRS